MLKVWKFFSVSVIVALVLPAGVFSLPQHAQNAPRQSALFTEQTVKVVAVKTQKRVVPLSSNNTIAQNADCSMATAISTNNLVQSGGAVNLNLPASCFSIVQSKVVAAPSLMVALIRPQTKIVVQRQILIAAAPAFIPKPLQQDSSLPTLVFLASAAVIVQERKSIQNAGRRLLKNIIQNLTLHQLGVLRC